MISIVEFLAKKHQDQVDLGNNEILHSNGNITVNGYVVKIKNSEHYAYWYELWKYIMENFAPDYTIIRRDAFIFLQKLSPNTFHSFDDYTSTSEYIGIKGPHCFEKHGNKLIALDINKWKKITK